ncbi:MAG: PilT/PilU family type 4a pilus ATPase [Deltaproteobacteria bacterium]|nr:PilT/PilU family type 4a pilus ATPase [Deltaproteobacteria bacterium]
MDAQGFVNLLAAALKHKVSDIHLHPGSAPAFRVKGDLIAVKAAAITEADMQVAIQLMVKDPAILAKITEVKDYDGSFEVPGLCRFRFNIFRHRAKLGAILRLIPATVPSLENLGMPEVLRKIASTHRGLVLLTGATGSGKSSTLAAMIDYINANFGMHILTIEDPLEFIHTPKKSRLTQREVGPDTNTFAGSLRSALRQDPDIILVGEMRDPETIDIALKAAETGHMVFSTVHTQDAAKTIGRLISVFKPEEQRMVRQRLADNLAATISQRLLKRNDGKGLIAAQEIMVVNTSIKECIEDSEKTGSINEYIQKSREMTGGQTFDQHLAELYTAGVVSLESALEAATNANDFQRNLSYASSSVSAGSGQENADGKGGAAPASSGPGDSTVVLDFAKEQKKAS